MQHVHEQHALGHLHPLDVLSQGEGDSPVPFPAGTSAAVPLSAPLEHDAAAAVFAAAHAVVVPVVFAVVALVASAAVTCECVPLPSDVGPSGPERETDTYSREITTSKMAQYPQHGRAHIPRHQQGHNSMP